MKYGTGILLSEKLVLTCAHNLYNQTTGETCTEAVFVPGVKSGKLRENKAYYSSSVVLRVHAGCDFNSKPTR